IAMPITQLARLTYPYRLYCMRRCRYVIAISEATRQCLIRVAGLAPERVVVVYYGVNKSFSPQSPDRDAVGERMLIRARHHLPSDAKIILHVNTKVRYKNTPALLHALAHLRHNPALREKTWLMRVGAALFEDEQALVEELGIGDRIVHV